MLPITDSSPAWLGLTLLDHHNSFARWCSENAQRHVELSAGAANRRHLEEDYAGRITHVGMLAEGLYPVGVKYIWTDHTHTDIKFLVVPCCQPEWVTRYRHVWAAKTLDACVNVAAALTGQLMAPFDSFFANRTVFDSVAELDVGTAETLLDQGAALMKAEKENGVALKF